MSDASQASPALDTIHAGQINFPPIRSDPHRRRGGPRRGKEDGGTRCEGERRAALALQTGSGANEWDT